MSNATTPLRNRIANHFNIAGAGTTQLIRPSAYTVGLYNGNAGLAAGAPTQEVSTSGTGYSQVSFTFTAGPNSNELINASEILFGTPITGWGTITHGAIRGDISGNGTSWEILWWNQLTNPSTGVAESVTVTADGARVRFQVGKLKVTIT